SVASPEPAMRLAFAVLAAAVFVAGCGSHCGPDNCDGCCDASGACQSSSVDTCGVSGAACVACNPLQLCVLGTCANRGGGAAGSGSGSPTASTGTNGTNTNGSTGSPTST